MSDAQCVGLLLTVFSCALVAYGAVIAKTGSKALMPMRVQHSIRSTQDVVRVGRIVVAVGAVAAGIAAVLFVIGA